MKLSKETINQHKKEIIAAGFLIAFATRAGRSYKLPDSHLTIDVSVWGDRFQSAGEKTLTFLGDVIDDTKLLSGRVAGKVLLGPKNQIINIIPEDGLETSENSIMALKDAVSSKEGWSAQNDQENTLQSG